MHRLLKNTERLAAAIVISIAALGFVSNASAAVVLNSSDSVNVNVTLNNEVARFNSTGLDLKDNDLYYFENQCGESEAVDGVFPNGTLRCTDVVTEAVENENLSTTLEAGNVANRKIDMNDNSVNDVSNLRGSDALPLFIRANSYVGAATERDIVFSTINSATDSWVTGLRIKADGSSSNVEVPSGDLNVSGNLSVSGSEGLELNNNPITGISKLDGTGNIINVDSQFRMRTHDLYLQGHDITNVDNLDFGNGGTNDNVSRISIPNTGVGGDRLAVTDNDGTGDILRFEDTGDLEIPNGKLSVGPISPSSQRLFEVQADSSQQYVMELDDSEGERQFRFRTDDSDGPSLWIQEPDGVGTNLKLSSTGSSYINGGKLGIGTSSPGAMLEVDGNVNITGELNASQGISINKENSIKDGSGTDRFEISDATIINNEDGNQILYGSEGVGTQLKAYSGTPFQIRDSQMGNSVAVEYTTSATSPGNLELTNTNLDMGGSILSNITDDGTSLIEFTGDQDVEIPNGNLNVSGNATVHGDRGIEFSGIGRIGPNGVDQLTLTTSKPKGIRIAPNNQKQWDFSWNGDLNSKGVDADINMGGRDIFGVGYIEGRTGFGKSFTIRNPDTKGGFVEFNNSGSIVFNNSITGEDILRMNASGGSDVEIPNGNLGVGVSSPSAALEVASSGSQNAFFFFFSDGTNWQINRYGSFFSNNGHYMAGDNNVGGAAVYSSDGEIYLTSGISSSDDHNVNINPSGDGNIRLNVTSSSFVRIPNGDLHMDNANIDFGTGVAANVDLSSGSDFVVRDSADNDLIRVEESSGDINLTGGTLEGVGATQCPNDEFLDGNGDCESVTSAGGSDDQNLQYSYPGSAPTASYQNQEIGIENGANITFRDYYEADTTVADDQNLSDVLNNGNNATFQNIDSLGSLRADNITLIGGCCGTGIDMANNDLERVNSFEISDTGGNEGFSWRGSNAEVYVAPLDDSNNDGYMQFVNDGGIAFEPGTDGTTELLIENDGEIDVNDNSLTDIGNLYSDDSSTNFFSGGANGQQTVSGINSDGTLQTTAISVSSSEIQSDAVTSSELASNTVTASGGELDSSVAGDNLNYNSGALDVQDNWVDENGDTMTGAMTFDIAGNDFFTLRDGSGGSNSAPYTLRYDTPRNFRLWSNQSSTVLEADHSGNIDIPSGDLDVSGQLTVGSTECSGTDEYIAGDGSCQSVSAATTADDQTLSEVLVQGNQANTSIDMQDNSIRNVKEITTSNGISKPLIDLHSNSSGDIWSDQGAQISIGEGGPTSRTKLHMTYVGDGDSYVGSGDLSNGVPMNGYIRFEWDSNVTRIKGKPVRIVSGDLDLNNNNIDRIGGLQGCGPNQYVNGDGDCQTDDSGTDNQGIDSVLDNGNTVSAGGTNNIDMNGQGSILNGDICTDGTCDVNNYETFSDSGIGVSNIYDGSGGEIDIQSPINFNSVNMKNIQFEDASALDSSGAINDFSDANDLDSNGDLQAGTVTNTELDNTANIQTGRIDVDSPSNTGGSLDVGGDIYMDGNSKLRSPREPGGTPSDLIGFEAGSQVLQVGSNSTIPDQLEILIPDDSGGQKVVIGTGSQNTAEFRRDGIVNIPNGNLYMNSNQIVDVADPTSAQDAATKNYVDNEVSSAGAPEDLSTTLEAGNTANQSIDMSGNNVDNVNQISGDSAAVKVSNNLDVQGNSVTSSSGEMCIGNACT